MLSVRGATGLRFSFTSTLSTRNRHSGRSAQQAAHVSKPALADGVEQGLLWLPYQSANNLASPAGATRLRVKAIAPTHWRCIHPSPSPPYARVADESDTSGYRQGKAIAEEAGFSKGVVYSQFGSKPDLFLALLERHIDERAAQNERIAAALAGAAGIQELIRAAQHDAAAEPGWAHVPVEFRALATRDPDLNRRYADLHARSVTGIASALTRLHERAGLQPLVSLRSMAEFILAGAAGMALERAANPDALPDSDVARILPRALGLHDIPSVHSRPRARRR